MFKLKVAYLIPVYQLPKFNQNQSILWMYQSKYNNHTNNTSNELFKNFKDWNTTKHIENTIGNIDINEFDSKFMGINTYIQTNFICFHM